MPTDLILEWLATYKYLVVLPLTLIQGPTVMLATGFLLKLGYFSLLPLYFTLMAGDLISDFLWYAVGRFGAGPFLRKFGKFFSVKDDAIKKLEHLFLTHRGKILFTSKVTTGFGFAMITLMTAGMARVPLKEYAIFNVAGGFVWTGILIAIGYFFGNLYVAVAERFKILFVIALVVVVALIIIGFGRFMKERFLANHKE
ncbi:MAG: DedA family protein [Candidatus Liptonbacteria bacterium]|nr:DedA family protein [Candidatus Liptonbacteria bacterium]